MRQGNGSDMEGTEDQVIHISLRGHMLAAVTAIVSPYMKGEGGEVEERSWR